MTQDGPTPAELFSSLFGGQPTHIARAPGRVNLIGEHIDYSELSVLPMAIQHEAQLAFRLREDGMVRITNTDPEFAPVEFEINPAITPGGSGEWCNYVQAPANEMARRFAIWRGVEGVFSSDIPVAAGLASSSALVNAVGLGARLGQAARISFRPLRMRHFAVPEGWCFVVADSGVREATSMAEEVLPGRLLRRFRHVVSEAARVEQAADCLLSADSAGFGGCIVALADRGTVDTVLEALVEQYFEPAAWSIASTVVSSSRCRRQELR